MGLDLRIGPRLLPSELIAREGQHLAASQTVESGLALLGKARIRGEPRSPWTGTSDTARGIKSEDILKMLLRPPKALNNGNNEFWKIYLPIFPFFIEENKNNQNFKYIDVQKHFDKYYKKYVNEQTIPSLNDNINLKKSKVKIEKDIINFQDDMNNFYSKVYTRIRDQVMEILGEQKYGDLGFYALGAFPYIDAFLKTDIGKKVECPEYVLKSIAQITADLENNDHYVKSPLDGQRAFMSIDVTPEEEARFVDGSFWTNPSFLRCKLELQPIGKISFIFLSEYDDDKLPGKDVTNMGKEVAKSNFIMKRNQCWRMWVSETPGVFYLKHEVCVPGQKYEVL